MLYEVAFGDINVGNWTLEEKEYEKSKVTMLTNTDTHAVIRLGQKVKPSINVSSISALETGISKAKLCEYELPKNILFSNNHKTMNVVLMNFWSQDKKEIAEHLDEDLYEIKVSKENYKLIGVECFYGDIINTYKRKDCVGALLRVRQYTEEYGLEKDTMTANVVKVILYDLKNCKYVHYIVKGTLGTKEDGTPTKLTDVRVEFSDKYNKELVTDLRNRYAEAFRPKSNNGFKCTAFETLHYTKAYVISTAWYDKFIGNGQYEAGTILSDQKIESEDDKIGFALGLSVGTIYDLVIIDKDELQNTESTSYTVLAKYIEENGIRAITTVNDVKISPVSCKELKLLYIFNIFVKDISDKEADTVKYSHNFKCVKSN